MHASIHSGGTGNIRHSPRNGFNSLLRAPRGPGFLARVIRHDQRLKARLGSTRPYSELDTSVGVPGPRVFAVRNNAARLARRDRSRIASPCDHLRTRHRRVHPHPTPTFVTTAIRPSSRGGLARKMPHNSDKRKCYFSREDWTIRIGLMRLTNSVFWRNGFWITKKVRSRSMRTVPVGRISWCRSTCEAYG